ncbi:MAG: glycosyltransferase family 2 protein [Planctomycetaceae bacterium]|jgi:glycosyltransferase involved in cell wall biosynthesis|nr:glycosyltransferase family 2 protein [Planctomycetaceae bacterium]
MLSFVIPVFNEADSLELLLEEIESVAVEQGYDYEVIFIDDGSTDGSWDVIAASHENDSRVSGLQFRRNFGKAAALNAGFERAQGEIVFTLDADLQDDPQEIPNFLKALEVQRVDVISGWKKKRYDPWHKVGPSRVFNYMVSRLTGVKLHDHNCGFKCYRSGVLNEIQLYGELHRFVPVLASARGWRVGEVVVNHRERQFGESKYGMKRIIKGFLDLLTVHLITGYGNRPQHLLGSLGLGCFAISGLTMSILTFWWVVHRVVGVQDPIDLHTRAIFYFSIAGVIIGIQLLTAGFLAELITKKTVRDEQIYSIKDSVGEQDNADA